MKIGSEAIYANVGNLDNPKGTAMTETELADRLERLERDNRRLKKLAAVALVIAAALGATYAARPVPDTITAREFDVVDEAGRARAVIDVDFRDAAGLYLRGADGKLQAELSAPPHRAEGTGLTVYDDGNKVTFLGDALGRPFLSLPDIAISGGEGAVNLTNALVGPGPFIELDNPQPHNSSGILIENSESPSINLTDQQGFIMNLGKSSMIAPKTGATEKTSAASIVMFGNDKGHHVIWQAP